MDFELSENVALCRNEFMNLKLNERVKTDMWKGKGKNGKRSYFSVAQERKKNIMMHAGKDAVGSNSYQLCSEKLLHGHYSFVEYCMAHRRACLVFIM